MLTRNPNEGHEAKSIGEPIDYSRMDKRFTQNPGAFARAYDTPEEATDVQSGSLKACHARTLGLISELQSSTQVLQDLLYRLDGRSMGLPPQNEISKVAEKEPDHPTFTARKIETLLACEIGIQRSIMQQIAKLIG